MSSTGGLMGNNELAWKVIDYWVKKNYCSKADAIEELGDLNALALEISVVIEEQGLAEDDGIEFISAQVDAALF